MKTRKEMVKEYKETKFPMGVFCIRNTANAKIFLGSSLNLRTVLESQRFRLRLGGHPNEALQKDWNEFGEESFVFEIVQELKELENSKADPGEELKVLEQMCLEEMQPYEERGYNPRPRKR